jgi:superfamily I DNA and/or RNA helicase
MVGFTSVLDLDVDPEDIGVIAPYKAQVRAIREVLKHAKLSDISVGSVEQFQGQVRVDRMFMRDGTDSGLL